jgi:hypothetical protein
MTKILQVRKEYQESFSKVVYDYAQMGYSRRFTATLLGFNLSYFRQLCSRFDLHKYFKHQSNMVNDCKPKGKGWIKGRSRDARYTYSNDDILSRVKQFPTYSEFICKSSINISTVKRRFNMKWSDIVGLAINNQH